jgi:cytochrome c
MKCTTWLRVVISTSMVYMLHGVPIQDPLELTIKKKIKDCKELVDRAVNLIEKKSLNDACQAFSRDKKWKLGEIQVFVFDEGGICMVDGNDHRAIWNDFQTKKTVAQEDFIAQMLTIGKGGGGLVNFTWNNAYMQAYVRTIVKNGTMYIIGAGFYPDSGRYIVQQLVNRALDYGASRPVSQLITRINNPVGMFVQGDLYLVMYDFKGQCVAHGKSLELVGQNLIDSQSNDGKYIVRDMIKIAKSEEGSGWYEYEAPEGGIIRRAYVHRLVSKEGKKYVIVGAYFPNVSETDVRTLVKRAISYMRTHGAKQSFFEFSQPRGPFAYGGITLFVYDMQGNIVADMSNPAFIGQNLINSVDADGRYVTRIIIQQAEKYRNGWISFNLKNAYTMMYIEKIKLPDGDFIVGASYYPVGKPVTVRFLVEKAARYLEQVPKEIAFGSFVSGTSEFFRGDTFIEVYDTDGTNYAYGPFRSHIYSLHLNNTDEKGIPIIKKLVAIAKSGGGWLEYNHNNRVRRVYAKLVIKERNASVNAQTVAGKEKISPENLIIIAGYYP